MDRPLTARRSTTVEEGQPETYSPGESSRKVKEGQGRSRQGQDKVKTRSRQGQDKVKTRSRQGQDNPSLPPVALVSHFSFFFWRSNPTMAAISDKEALAYLLEQVLQADVDALVMLALEQAGVRTALDLMPLEVSQDMPLKYDRPAEGSEKARKNVPLLPAEICQIKGLKNYIRYHMMNVANKYYESHEDWEKLTAKGLVHFHVNIAPTLPPMRHLLPKSLSLPLSSTTLSEIGKRGSSMT